MQSDALLSIRKFCDNDCVVTFTKHDVAICLNDKLVCAGKRSSDGLWRLPLTNSKAYHLTGLAGAADHVAFAHAALFSPALSTLETALKMGYVRNFPGLTYLSLKRFPPQSVAMHKGHLDQARANQRSTRQDRREKAAFVTMYDAREHSYSDQTGQFVIPSSSGNKYVMVLYDFDSNAILVKSFASKSAVTIRNTFESLFNRLCAAGHRPALHRLDNACPVDLKIGQAT